MNSPFKMRKKLNKSCPWKKQKPVFTIPQRHIYIILKGRFEVTPQSFPTDIFWLDILWHFQLNIADIPAVELKACLKRDTSIKALSLPASLSPSLTPPPPPPPPSSLHLPAPSSSHSNTGLHALPTKCGWLASPGIRGGLFNPGGLPKILSPIIHRRQTQSAWLGGKLMGLFWEDTLIKMQEHVKK